MLARSTVAEAAGRARARRLVAVANVNARARRIGARALDFMVSEMVRERTFGLQAPIRGQRIRRWTRLARPADRAIRRAGRRGRMARTRLAYFHPGRGPVQSRRGGGRGRRRWGCRGGRGPRPEPLEGPAAVAEWRGRA